MGIAVRMILACEPADVSALYFMQYVQQAGGLEALVTCTNGAQEQRVQGGTQQISERLAADVAARSGRVLLSAPVQQLEHAPAGGVRAHTADGRTFSARFAIVALPPALAARLRFSPALPLARDQLSNRVRSCSLHLCVHHVRM